MPQEQQAHSDSEALPSTSGRLRKAGLPRPRYHCLCLECSTGTQDVNPETGLPGTGRWLHEGEWRAHQRRQERREVIIAQVNPDELIDRETGWDSSSSAPSLSRNTSLETLSSSSSRSSGNGNPSSSPTARVLSRLSTVSQQIRDAASVTRSEAIIFVNPPDPLIHSREFIANGSEEEKNEACRLDPSYAANTVLIGYKETLDKARALAHRYTTSKHPLVRQRASNLSQRIDEQSLKLRKILWKEWRRQRTMKKKENVIPTEKYFERPFQHLHSVILGLYLMVATLYYLPGLSMNACGFILRCLSRVLLAFASQCADPELKAAAASGLPSDIRTVTTALQLSPSFRAYISCPKCFSLYPFQDGQRDSYPEQCIRSFDGTVCGALLRKKRKRTDGKEYELPVREFLYQDVGSYLSRLFSRPELQRYLYRNPITDRKKNQSLWDIWDAPCLREFRGPDNRIFVDSPDGESHLIFSLNMDGLNPYGSRESGKKVSVGAIYMICLNLPPSLRYDVENIFLVGIIPGPDSPSTDQINYLLRPLIDDLIVLWKSGYLLTRTTRYVRGWLVKVAVVPLVCDLPAARQMAGFAHHSSNHFCSVCKQTKPNINNIDPSSWKLRTWKEHFLAASLWKNAETTGRREEVFRTYGVRWSEMLRLPYWDPTRFTVIDSMHAFYLQLFQHHCRKVWGMDADEDDGDGITFDPSPDDPSEDDMRRAYDILHHGSDEELKNLDKAILRQLCMELSLPDFRTIKNELLNQLKTYRSRCQAHTGGFERPPDLADYTSHRDLQASKSPHTPPLSVHDGSSFKTVEDIESFFISASKGKLNALRKPDLLLVFRSQVQPFVETDESFQSWNMDQLKEKITARRIELGICDEEGNWIDPDPIAKPTRVLGRETLAEVREDIRKTTLPTWMDRSPRHPGESKWGKFTADQWRTFCLVNLPLTLIRLWGHMPADSVQRRRLDNFMHLVTAVKLATMRKIDHQRIQQYEHHMYKYLKTLLELYPNTQITPYQHMALHFGGQLRRFGPVHAWRCFPFERYNYILQNFDHNQRLGDLEKTLFIKFCGAQNIRTYFHPEVLPDGLLGVIETFQQSFDSDIRGTRISDALYYDEKYEIVEERETWSTHQTKELSEVEFELLGQWISTHDEGCRYSKRVFERASISFLGEAFSTIHHTEANSGVVLLESGGKKDQWTAAKLEKIFSHRRARPDGEAVIQSFAFVRWLSPLEVQESRDIYRRYPVAGGRIFRRSFTPVLGLVALEDIHCQFASYPFQFGDVEEEHIVVLPLNKE